MAPLTAPTPLPPDAWARPGKRPEARRAGRSRWNHPRRWLPLLLALPFMLGIGHRGGELVVNGADHGFGVSAGVLDDNPGSGTVVTPVTDGPAIAAPLPGRPGVEPWSTAESRLRIEVVSTLTGTANVAVSGTFAAGSWGPRDFSGTPLPVAYDVVLGGGTTGLEVTDDRPDHGGDRSSAASTPARTSSPSPPDVRRPSAPSGSRTVAARLDRARITGEDVRRSGLRRRRRGSQRTRSDAC